MDCVIGESCWKGIILHRDYRKMTIKWSFSYNSFVKFHDKNKLGATTGLCSIHICVIFRKISLQISMKKIGSHNMTVFYPNQCNNDVC